MIYIQYKDNYGLETVDHFEKRKDALAALREYQMHSGGEYYLSSRPCKGYWS